LSTTKHPMISYVTPHVVHVNFVYVYIMLKKNVYTVFWDILVSSQFSHFCSDGYSFILASLLFATCRYAAKT